MSVPAKCRRCGYRYTARSIKIENSFDIHIEGCTETCPRCGGTADLQSGTYDFMGDVMTAFRAASPRAMEQFRSVAVAASNGSMTVDEAAQQVGKINSNYATILEWAFDKGLLAILITLVGLYIQIAAARDSDEASRETLELLREQVAVSEQMLQRMDEHRNPPEPPVQFAKQTRAKAVGAKELKGNRHERRKARKLAKTGHH